MRTSKLRLLSCSLFRLLLLSAFLSLSAAAQTTAPNEWTWMGGSNKLRNSGAPSLTGQPGVYGTLGTPATGNIPGGRDSAATWTDSNGNFWLLGGTGFDANANYGYMSDLWKFNPSNNMWTWMGGGSTLPASCAGSSTVTCGQPAVYGTLGAPAAANIPGAAVGLRTGPTVAAIFGSLAAQASMPTII